MPRKHPESITIPSHPLPPPKGKPIPKDRMPPIKRECPIHFTEMSMTDWLPGPGQDPRLREFQCPSVPDQEKYRIARKPHAIYCVVKSKYV